MARGIRRPIEDKINEKKELIQALETRIEKEKKELTILLNEQKQQEVETLYVLLKESNISIQTATEMLKNNLCNA